jgi:lipid-binding SYLF domain-containing protein
LVAQDTEPAARLSEAAAVFSEIMAATDTSIPQDLLEKAHCVVIVPGLKTAAFGFGAKYGKGYLACRNSSGKGWSAPGTVRIEGGSVGFQIGGSSTDLVMLVMSERGVDKLLSSKFTLGVEGSVAAGPVGRTATAQTDAQMRADMLSWSRSQGLFAGVALEGATLRQDLDDNTTLYGKKLENREIVTSGVQAPQAAAELLTLINKHSAREGQGVSSASPSGEKKGSPLRTAGSSAALRHEDIKKVQTNLNDKGFDCGPADGYLGPRTRVGIRQFQESENLPGTGRLDAETAGKLGVGPESIGGNFAGAGHDVAEGSKELGHEVKQGKPVAAGKEFGKGIGRAAQKVGAGVVQAVSPDSDRGDREEQQKQQEQAGAPQRNQ